jgi:AcrR family transcriptional regulator
MPSAASTFLPNAGASTPLQTDGETAPKSRPRTRLDVDARRAQLLKLGRELLTTRAYGDLSIEEIARRGGISKGLLYRYFKSKRAFYMESVLASAGELLQQSAPPEARTPLERVRAGIDVYLRYVERHKGVFATLIWRGLVHDQEIRNIVESTTLRFFERVLTEVSNSPIRRNALRAWVAFIEASVRDWIEHSDLEKREVTDLLMAVLQQILAAPGAEG